MRVAAGVVALLAVALGSAASAGRVAGRIAILEKDNKPSPDLSDAVLYLEAPAPVSATATARPVTVEIAITDKTYAPHVMVVPVGSTVRFRITIRSITMSSQSANPTASTLASMVEAKRRATRSRILASCASIATCIHGWSPTSL